MHIMIAASIFALFFAYLAQASFNYQGEREQEWAMEDAAKAEQKAKDEAEVKAKQKAENDEKIAGMNEEEKNLFDAKLAEYASNTDELAAQTKAVADVIKEREAKKEAAEKQAAAEKARV